MDKIGLHIIGGTQVNLGRPRLVKLVNVDAAYVRQVRQEVGPEALIIVRWVEAWDLGNPEQAARDWYARHHAQMAAMADANVAFESCNEVPDDLAPLYARFEAERLSLMHEAGLRSVVGNFSVGTPDLDVWATYRPMLQAMRAGDLLGLHEYWSDQADIANRWHCGRWTLAPVLKDVPIVVTECGRDVVEGQGQPGWKRTCGPAEFLEDLRRYDALLRQFPNVLGATVFTVGVDAGWASFDTTPVWPQVVAGYSVPQTYPGASVPQPEPPATQPKPDHAGAIWKGSPNYGYPRGAQGRGGRKPIAIVYHITEGTLAATDSWLANPSSEVSYHYAVGPQGQIHQYVREADAAWHAGVVNQPRWTLLTPGVNPNLDTIGIAWAGRTGEQMTEAAYQALLALTRGVLARHQILASGATLVGHKDIDSVNKEGCPGEAFPWARLFTDLIPNKGGTMLEQTVRNAAWNAGGIPYNVDAAFPRYAREHDLGNPVTPEFDFSHQGVAYRGQGYSKGIVYARVDDWSSCKIVKW